ncbi:hypothetical protein XS16_005437 [Salmonella enterica subsp. enterica serovar Newport]|nr:hypothetical protein [Salmonella enterica]EDT3088945.1 hypothetical protein [Salmonella enterica subsp. enterica serovar Newport]
MSKLTAVETAFYLIYNEIIEDYESKHDCEVCNEVDMLIQQMTFVYTRLFLVIQNHRKTLSSGITEASNTDALTHLLARKTNRAADEVRHMNLSDTLLTLRTEIEYAVQDKERQFLGEEAQVNKFVQSQHQYVLSEAAKHPPLPEMSLQYFWYLVEKANHRGLSEQC